MSEETFEQMVLRIAAATIEPVAGLKDFVTRLKAEIEAPLLAENKVLQETFISLSNKFDAFEEDAEKQLAAKDAEIADQGDDLAQQARDVESLKDELATLKGEQK